MVGGEFDGDESHGAILVDGFNPFEKYQFGSVP